MAFCFIETNSHTHTHKNTHSLVSPCQRTTGLLCSAHMVGCRKTSMSAEGVNRVSFLVSMANVEHNPSCFKLDPALAKNSTTKPVPGMKHKTGLLSLRAKTPELIKSANKSGVKHSSA